MSDEIADKWENLGRGLNVKESKIQEIRQAWPAQLSEKGYHMLLHWKQEQGSAATYQVLYDALKERHLDLAEKFCHTDAGKCSVPLKVNI